ncbi:MAG: Cysteinyl-tRNA synthetase [Labilithrix sp.]|nr:Cysteinyl-tRNA synthetase [Labilithrix sp.]
MTGSLVLYDNFTRSLRPFEPLQPNGEVGLYTCGPTVYDDQHLGNYRTFLFEDFLKRVLRWNGFRVKHVMNVTDVGHLVSDADDGEDKMEKGARRAGKSAWDIAEHYTRAFIDDLALLRIERADVLCRATDHIADQIEFIVDVERRGFTYRTSDGIYFDTSRLPSYGALARLDTAGLDAGRRVAMGAKRSATDFALWKFSPARGARREMDWDSPWGIGFPGCTSNAPQWRRSISANSSTFTAVGKITFPSTIRTRSRRPRRESAHDSRTSGCMATSSFTRPTAKAENQRTTRSGRCRSRRATFFASRSSSSAVMTLVPIGTSASRAIIERSCRFPGKHSTPRKPLSSVFRQGLRHSKTSRTPLPTKHRWLGSRVR